MCISCGHSMTWHSLKTIFPTDFILILYFHWHHFILYIISRKYYWYIIKLETSFIWTMSHLNVSNENHQESTANVKSTVFSLHKLKRNHVTSFIDFIIKNCIQKKNYAACKVNRCIKQKPEMSCKSIGNLVSHVFNELYHIYTCCFSSSFS
jgi:hypothetical protein